MPKLSEIYLDPDKFKGEGLRPWSKKESSQQPSATKDKKKSKTTKVPIKSENNDSSPGQEETVIQVDPQDVYVTPNKVDRSNIDSNSLEALALTMSKVGQLQPCVVRKSSERESKLYELIFGERRYRAALLKGLKLKVTIKEISDHEAALQLLAENQDREDNTDYELGRQVSQYMGTGVLSQSDIVVKLGVSKQKISKLLSYEKIPNDVFAEIQDFNKVSATTAESLAGLCSDPTNIPYIIEMSKKIRDGSYGHTKIKDYIKKRKRSTKELNNSFRDGKIYSNTGRHIFTWRRDNNDTPSIHFPKDIVRLMDLDKLDFNSISYRITELVESEINNKKSKSNQNNEES